MTVAITADALRELAALPLPIQARARQVFARLANWPNVSGAKPLRKNLKGNWRVRTGDYRVVFRIETTVVVVWRIGYRGDVYD